MGNLLWGRICKMEVEGCDGSHSLIKMAKLVHGSETNYCGVGVRMPREALFLVLHVGSTVH